MKKSDKISSMKDLSNVNVQHVHSDAVDYLLFPVFMRYGVVAINAIKGRQNLSYSGEAAIEFQNLCKAVGADFNKVVYINEQVHGDTCVRVDSPDQEIPPCDCLMTNVPGIALVTREADCIPILVFDPVHRAITNVHSGWRGTVKHIVRVAIEKMKNEYETNPADLMCALLPSIGADHFLVHDDVRLPFENEFNVVNIQPLNDGYLLDAVSCVKEDLLKSGVLPRNIIDSEICATCEADQINSCRGGAGKMRNAAVIFIKEEDEK